MQGSCLNFTFPFKLINLFFNCSKLIKSWETNSNKEGPFFSLSLIRTILPEQEEEV